MVEILEGSWVLVKNENFGELLEALGVNIIKREFALRLTTYVDIEVIGPNKFALKSVTGPVTKKRQMTLEEEFDDVSPAGGKMTGSWKLVDGTMLVGTFNFKQGGKKMIMKRYVKEDQFIEEMIIDKISCKRYYKKKL